DTAIKVRPLAFTDLEHEFRSNSDVKCELDVHAGDASAASSACSLTVKVGDHDIADVGRGDHSIKSLFNSAQEDFLAAHGPSTVTWDDVAMYGPVPSLAWEIKTDDLPAKLAAEISSMPDGTQILEMSIKVPEADASDDMKQLLHFLNARGL